jgi:hypothetical protein
VLRDEVSQRRDEGTVKLLFADHSGPAAMHRLIRFRREEAQHRHDLAEATVPGSEWPDTGERSPDSALAAVEVPGDDHLGILDGGAGYLGPWLVAHAVRR